jgi:DNA-binding beta-propeller fold protein YncE
MLGTARLVGALLLYLFVLGCGNDNVAIPTYGIGLVAFSNGYVGVIDPITQTVSGPFLNGEIGTVGGGSFDVVITPDRSTALVSNFGDSTIYFINMSVPSAPTVRGSLVIPFFAEDIALTPNGRYALVTDGGFSPSIAVIDVQNRTLVEVYTDTTLPTANSFEAVAVAADGKTVLTVDFFGGAVNTLTIDDAGHLTYVGRTDISNGGTLLPVNISISPDGKTAIAAVVATTADPLLVPADVMRFPVLEITAPGVVALKRFVATDVRLNACQSIVFNPSGTKAYALSNQEDPDSTDAIAPFNTIVDLNVTMPGLVSDSGVTTNVDFISSGQLYGVDTIAMDLTGRYLYVSNMSVTAANHLQVVDVLTGTVVKTITFDPVVAPPVTGVLLPAIPTGVFIR